MLPNRLRFINQITTTLEQSHIKNQMVVLIDIDAFAEINDVLGHHYGDLLLRSVADRLQRSLGNEVFLARVGGDIFGLLGSGIFFATGTLAKLIC